jgi:hypothetical protein
MSDEPVISWKHIGLYGYAVGTLALYKDMVVWKSALLGRNEGATADDLSTLTTRKIAATRLKAAIWTWMGKNMGLLRIAIANSDSKQSYQQDWRLDGFPAADFDLLKAKWEALYQMDLQVGNMSAAGTQYGVPSIKNKWLTLSHCTLQDDLNEEGQEFEVVISEPICHLDLNEITQCVIPGNNNRNEIELQFPESDTIEAGTDQLGALLVHFYDGSVAFAYHWLTRSHTLSRTVFKQSRFACTFHQMPRLTRPTRKRKQRPNCCSSKL